MSISNKTLWFYSRDLGLIAVTHPDYNNNITNSFSAVKGKGQKKIKIFKKNKNLQKKIQFRIVNKKALK